MLSFRISETVRLDLANLRDLVFALFLFPASVVGLNESHRLGPIELLIIEPPDGRSLRLEHSDGFHRDKQPKRLIGESSKSIAFVKRSSSIVLCINDHGNGPDLLTRLEAAV